VRDGSRQDHTEREPTLRDWCRARGLTSTDLARLAGCSARSAQRWVRGDSSPGPAARVRLYRLTRLERYRPTPAGELAAMGPSERARLADAAAAVEEALGLLEKALEPFARGTPGARELLRRSLDPARVGRVTNLAQLMLDEDAFADWRLLAGTLLSDAPAGAPDRPGDVEEERDDRR